MGCDINTIELIIFIVGTIAISFAIIIEQRDVRDKIHELSLKVKDIDDDLNDLEELYNDGNGKKTDD